MPVVDDNPINDILIVGGGTAGWLTAAYLAKQLGANRPDGVKITLIESSEIGILGVGEGTFPTILKTLSAIGVDEARFMRESSGAFKQGIKFVDWVHAPQNAHHTHYYHPFALPRQEGGVELLPYWLMGAAGEGVSFADAVTLQGKVCDAGRAPKRATDAAYRGPMNYAYHLDAGRFAALLCDVGKELGVRRLLGNVETVNLDENGAIASLTTREHGELKAGLYIDCTGFRGQLIGRALGVPFKSKNDVLFVDRAVAIQVPYATPDAPIPPYTISTAHEAGWTWDIGLDSRRGVGYVYSSSHTDDSRAEDVLRSYIGPASRDLNARLLKLQIGWRERHWVKNCVAVGLAGGFLEPLESTGIIMIEAAAYMIASFFPRAGGMAPAADLFNRLMNKRYERIVDFIKMHYFLTQRTDSAFWLDNARPATATDSLLAQLEMWRHRVPGRFDFVMDHETFALANYHFILYGMDFPTDVSANRAAYPHLDTARQEFMRVRQASQRAVDALPRHRDLLEHVYKPGFKFAAQPSQPQTLTSFVR
ncbi:MAG: tryptophan halogenase family protein [Steroidobacter sp.]